MNLPQIVATMGASNPYAGNIIINPDFSEGSTNWSEINQSNVTTAFQNSRYEITTTGTSAQVTINTAQTIPDANYTVYILLTHSATVTVVAFDSILGFPIGNQYSDTVIGSGTSIISGSLNFIGGGGSANLSVDFQIPSNGATVFVTGVYLVPQ